MFAEFRKLDCVTEDKSIRGGPQKARCHLVIKDVEDEEPGRNAPEGDGCFSVSVRRERLVEFSVVS